MNLSIIHTANIGILIDSLGPYKYFDIKNLEFHPQKIANRPPPKPKQKNAMHRHLGKMYY